MFRTKSPNSRIVIIAIIFFANFGCISEKEGQITQIPSASETSVLSATLKSMENPIYSDLSDFNYGSIHGQLYIIDMDRPLSVMRVLLSPAVMEGNKCNIPPIITSGREELGDIIVYTDKDGRFEADSIKPGNYYVIVNYPDHTEIARHPTDTTTPLCIEIKQGKDLSVGTLYVYR